MNGNVTTNKKQHWFMFGGMHDARLVHDDLEKLCKFEHVSS